VPDLHRRLRERRPLEDPAQGGGPGREAARGVIVERRRGEVPRAIPATAELLRQSSLAKERAFQTPALFDYTRGRPDPFIDRVDE